MGLRGPGANPIMLAARAATNPKIRPRRRRELQVRALNDMWDRRRPADGARLKKFNAALKEVWRGASYIGIPPELFDEWADALCFEVDDRDMDAP